MESLIKLPGLEDRTVACEQTAKYVFRLLVGVPVDLKSLDVGQIDVIVNNNDKNPIPSMMISFKYGLCNPAEYVFPFSHSFCLYDVPGPTKCLRLVSSFSAPLNCMDEFSVGPGYLDHPDLLLRDFLGFICKNDLVSQSFVRNLLLRSFPNGYDERVGSMCIFGIVVSNVELPKDHNMVVIRHLYRNEPDRQSCVDRGIL